MIVYAKIDGVIIWADRARLHKQGRVALGEPLTVVRDYSENWFKIERPEHITLPENTNYPHYWVRKEFVTFLPEPEPDPEPVPDPDPIPGEISEETALRAVGVLLRYLKQ
jgi:hypothetical protein